MGAFDSIFGLSRDVLTYAHGESIVYISADAAPDATLTAVIDAQGTMAIDRGDGPVLEHSIRVKVNRSDVDSPARGDIVRYDSSEWGYAGEVEFGNGYWRGLFTRVEPVNKTRQGRERR